MKKLLSIGICAVFVLAWFPWASAHAGAVEFSGAFKASFGATQYLDFVDGGRASTSSFDATRELGLKLSFIANENLRGVVSFQIGEGSTGGYFGSTDALVGGEEDGNLILELDNLYIDFTVPGTQVNFKVGSQGAVFADLIYGSNLMYEVPAGVAMKVPFGDLGAFKASWFRMTDLRDDTKADLEDQADLFYLEVPLSFGRISLVPYAAYALIGEDVVNDPTITYWRYTYFNYPGYLQGAFGPGFDTTVTDDVEAYYGGLRYGLNFDPINIQGTATYGAMEWDAVGGNVDIAGFFADLVVDYKTKYFTPELFMFYGNGPDANDEDLDLMPPLIGGPTYTSSFFGGSRFNDNLFDSHDTTYASGMWAVGFKLKDIKFGNLSNELQVMYAEGTADDTLFEAPDDILLNEDESFIELNFNSEYQLMESLVLATEFGYIVFDEDSDYNDPNRPVEDFWKATLALEYYF